MPPISSNASSVTMPDGLALAETGWIKVQPNLSAASKVAPRAERVPRNAAGISLSRWKSRRRHSAMSVFCTLKVLVSCMNRPVRTRVTVLSPNDRTVLGREPAPGATGSDPRSGRWLAAGAGRNYRRSPIEETMHGGSPAAGAASKRGPGHAPHSSTMTMPGRYWYAVAALVWLAGAAGAFAFLRFQLMDLAPGLMRVVVPGSTVLDLSEPGSYTIFHESESVLDGRIYAVENVSGLRVTLRSD